MATKKKRAEPKSLPEPQEFSEAATAAALRRACWSARGWARRTESPFARSISRVLAGLLHVVERGSGDLSQAEGWAHRVLQPELPRVEWYFQQDTRDPFPERWAAMEQLRAESSFHLRHGVELHEIVVQLMGSIEELVPELAHALKPSQQRRRQLVADCEALVREALRRAGMPAGRARSVFNYRDRRALRTGHDD